MGLLDEDLFMYGDDVDWCRRAWNAGWQVVFYPGAEAIHDRGKITAPYPVRFAVAQQRSVLHYWTKHHGFFGRTGNSGPSCFSITCCATRSLSLAGLRHPREVRKGDVGKQVSGACLRELLSGSVPNKA